MRFRICVNDLRVDPIVILFIKAVNIENYIPIDVSLRIIDELLLNNIVFIEYKHHSNFRSKY